MTANVRFQQRVKVKKKTRKHKKSTGPKDKKVSKYRGQGKT